MVHLPGTNCSQATSENRRFGIGRREREKRPVPPDPEGALESDNVGALTLEGGSWLREPISDRGGEVPAGRAASTGLHPATGATPSPSREGYGRACAAASSQFSWEGVSGRCCDIWERMFPRSPGWRTLPVKPVSQGAGQQQEWWPKGKGSSSPMGAVQCEFWRETRTRFCW